MKNSSAIIISLSIILGFAILGYYYQLNSQNNQNRYEFVPTNNIIIIFDKQTGQYWGINESSVYFRAFWEKGDSPIK